MATRIHYILPAFLFIWILLLPRYNFANDGDTNPDNFFLQQLDNSSGLSNSSINTIFQDSEDLLWVGTWDGLNMYDGTDFKVLNYSATNPGSGIGNNVILGLAEGRDANIWITTIGGITRMDKRNGKFYRYFYNNAKRRKISEQEFNLTADKNGHTYCYNKTDGLKYFDSAANAFKKITLIPNTSQVKEMTLDNKSHLWILDEKGVLSVYKPLSSTLKFITTIKTPSKVDQFFWLDNRLIISCHDQLFIANSRYLFTRIPGSYAKLKSITKYNSKYILISQGQELRILDDRFSPSSFNNSASGTSKLSGIRATSCFVSKDGTLWIGTDGNGLFRIYPKKNYFGQISRGEGYDFNKPVRAFAEIGKSVWVGTKGKGIIRFPYFGDNSKNRLQHDFISTRNGLNNDAVFALKYGKLPFVYIGTDGKGFAIYDLRSNKIINWPDIQGSNKLPLFGSVYAILEDQDRSLWLGTSGSGLIHLKLGFAPSGKLYVKDFKQYLSETTRGLANDIIYALALTDNRYLWIACRYGGLSVLDKRTRRFKTFSSSGRPSSLSNNDVLSLYCDKHKGLWIGTSFGLNYLSYRQSLNPDPHFVRFTTNDGLPNNTIHAIREARNGEIWLSTNKGLARLKPASRIITNFNSNDGLQSNEFSDGAVMESQNGFLFFGGIHGFNYFRPENIKSNIRGLNLLVSQFQLGGKSTNENQLLVLKTAGFIPAHYTVDREMNVFRLTLKPISFINPVKNQFRYKLDGFDKNWNYSGSEGNIVYNNLSPGNYTLLVRWANEDGIWTQPIHVFSLRVKQYFWLSYPALTLYLTFIILMGYLFYRYRKNKLEMKFRLRMETQLRQKDENIHQQRLNFFTNIAHEIQTPLTLIMGSIEHFLSDKKKEILQNKENVYFLSLVHQHSVRLTYLVQQLLEFRKAEAGFLRKKNNYIDVSKMLNSLTALFEGESKKNCKTFDVSIAEGIAGFIDKDKLEKILFNLLSNAFKHSPKQAQIAFSAYCHDQTLTIDVCNSGCILREDEINHLFNKFYTKDGTTVGEPSTGIGLAFAKELATLIDADISVKKTEDGYICFTLSLPLSSTAEEAPENEVATSAPSYLYEELLKHYEQPPLSNADEENKITFIDNLHQNLTHSILLVEDDPELRFLLHQVLKANYIIYEAANGLEALSFLKKFTPNLIISDVMMPDMDGITLCTEVKNTPATAHIPFIILSAKGTEENKKEGYEVGADAYILKPFNINYLQVRIRKLLDYHDRMQTLIKDQNITNQFTTANIADADKEFLEAILKVIENNLDATDLNAATIENQLLISKMQLYRKLKSIAGMTPAEFIKRVRLKHAADMLQNSQFTVSEIIYKTGFNSKSYFFREFKKIYQCAPTDYRARQYQSSLNSSTDTVVD